jgi:DHA2 family multidrug resistance protein
VSIDAAESGAPPSAPSQRIPWLGLTAVLLGTIISTLNTRVSGFGLADIRGAVHASFDGGAWITTAQTSSQMLVTPVSIWLGGVYGPRRVLIAAASALAIVSTLAPFSRNLPELLFMQFGTGAATGFFIPLTLPFILRALPRKYWSYGVALYGLSLELSLNTSASLEGLYVDYISWHWIYWQNVPLALGMALCLIFGVARTPPGPQRPKSDLFGFFAGGAGLAMIYAGLDQGNRLDWLNDGLIWGLLLGGALLFVGFLIHETRTAHPAVDLKVAASRPVPAVMLLIAFLRLTLFTPLFLIPQYLDPVRGYRALDVGQSLLWVAGPQLVLCPLAGHALRWVDPRFLGGVGFLLISVACLMPAYTLTSLWGTDQFVPSQALQALAQSLALSSVLFYGVLHFKPEQALSFGGVINTARLMGGEAGSAFLSTLLRFREQAASNHLGLHVQVGGLTVAQRLATYEIVARRTGNHALAPDRSLGILSVTVRNAAIIQSVIDTFIAVAFLSAAAALFFVCQRAPPRAATSEQPAAAPARQTG